MKKRVINLYDTHMAELNNIVTAARDLLIAKAQEVITKKGVIDLYPEGADQKVAIKALEDAKYSLLCAIGNYDGRLSELRQYYTDNHDNFAQYWATPDRFRTSHDLIESAYRHYFKG